MNKLLVVNTYREKLDLSKQINQKAEDISIASLEDGAGRATVPPHAKVDLVVLPKCKDNGELVEYANRLANFIEDLTRFNLVHSKTIMH